MTLLDYKDIKETKDLPISWISLGMLSTISILRDVGRNAITTGMNPDNALRNYMKQQSFGKAYLRQTTLGNGLKYVTIHLVDGIEIFNCYEYQGWEGPCRCGCGNFPIIAQAKGIKEADLGDGFKIQYLSDYPDQNTVETHVEKEFKAADNIVKVNYSLKPNPGSLFFSYVVLNQVKPAEPDRVENLPSGGQIVQVSHDRPKKWMEVQFRETNNPNDRCSVSFASNKPHLLLNSQEDARYEFGLTGHFRGVFDNQGKALPKDRCLTDLGRDISTLHLNTRETLNVLVQAALKGEVADISQILKFE